MNVMPVQANQRTNFSGARSQNIPRYFVDDLVAKGLQLMEQGRTIQDFGHEIRVLSADGAQVVGIYAQKQKATQALATA